MMAALRILIWFPVRLVRRSSISNMAFAQGGACSFYPAAKRRACALPSRKGYSFPSEQQARRAIDQRALQCENGSGKRATRPHCAASAQNLVPVLTSNHVGFLA